MPIEITNNFIEQVRKYCTLIENIDQYSRENFFDESLKTLPIIYSLGLQLPDVEDDSEETINNPVENYFSKIYEKINLPTKTEDDKESIPILVDDLTDIYTDLKEALVEYDKEGRNTKNDAIWKWKFDMHTHSGHHIVSALGIMHPLYW